MAGNLQQRIDRIIAKAALIDERYRLLAEAKAVTDNRVGELEAEVDTLRRQLSERDREIERLRVASALAPDHSNVEEARALLTELVREIDKCIKQLSI